MRRARYDGMQRMAADARGILQTNSGPHECNVCASLSWVPRDSSLCTLLRATAIKNYSAVLPISFRAIHTLIIVCGLPVLYVHMSGGKKDIRSEIM